MRAHSPNPDPVDYEHAKRRAEKKFAIIDKLTPEVRAVIHEYGWEPVQLLMELGVKRAGRLLHIIRACRGEPQ